MKLTIYNGKSSILFIAYSVIFGLFFIRFFMADSLPATTDTLLYIAHFEYLGQYFNAWFQGVDVPSSFYPAGPAIIYGDPCFFLALLYLPFRILGFAETQAWILMLWLVYTLNAFAAYKFFSVFTRLPLVAFWAGLGIGGAGYLFGNIDSPNVFFLATMLACLYYTVRFFREGVWQKLFLAVAVGCATLYFSSYTFVFQSILVVVLAWLFKGYLLGVPNLIVKLLVGLFLVLLLIGPFVYFMVMPGGISSAWNPLDTYNSMLPMLSLDLKDFVRVMPGNLLYPPLNDGYLQNIFFYRQHAAFPGISLVMLALVGVFSKVPYRGLWLFVFGLGFVLSVGPSVSLGGYGIPMPLSWVYQHTDLESFVRASMRFWVVGLIGLVGLSIPVVEGLAQRARGKWILAALCCLYLAESVPWHAKAYPAASFLQPDEASIAYLKAQQHAIVLDLPSRVYSITDVPDPLNEYGREHLYMVWQTKYLKPNVNGSNGFLPYSRLAVNDLVCRLTEDGTLMQLNQDYGVTHLVYHKNLFLPDDDWRLASYLEGDPRLRKVLQTPQTIVYVINKE